MESNKKITLTDAKGNMLISIESSPVKSQEGVGLKIVGAGILALIAAGIGCSIRDKIQYDKIVKEFGEANVQKLDAIISGLGNGGAHGWNIVKIENSYYNVDATWDINFTKSGYQYYLLTDSNFKNHVRADEYNTSDFYAKYPMGTQNYTAAMNEEYKSKIQNVCSRVVELLGKMD